MFSFLLKCFFFFFFCIELTLFISLIKKIHQDTHIYNNNKRKYLLILNKISKKKKRIKINEHLNILNNIIINIYKRLISKFNK